jgi:ribosomal-protein-alanine N-acetyltransferase
VEVGWRLVRTAWGHGFATEAARAAIDDGFSRVGLPEIVSFTARSNLRSQAVMERLGMERDENRDFDHPKLAPDHPLRPHVVYATRPS